MMCEPSRKDTQKNKEADNSKEVRKMKDKESVASKSGRLRHTKEVAELCGFEYSTKPYRFGGFFSGFQCEAIVKTIETLKAKVAELKRDVELIKEVKKNSEGK